jgi:hypothetical protein
LGAATITVTLTARKANDNPPSYGAWSSMTAPGPLEVGSISLRERHVHPRDTF